MSGISFSGQVPGEQTNGLIDMEDEIMRLAPTPEPWLAVVVMERAKWAHDDQKDQAQAIVRFKHIEPIRDEGDAKAARALLEKAYAERTGEASLPIPLDDVDDEGPEAA